ncbi:putative lysozyme-like protein [Teleopsis dalmanni]|uniref:putative lysozyme-like protein n=1 Tax=Teleopsis dalmanni TaxID=139649 RepID=UPI0018CC9162|nr:putative lysozyme-like protein [Teleopsis dalmanni]
MKLFYILLLTLPLLAYSFPAAEEKSISLEEDVDNEHAESEQDSQIQKRSGNSFDYVTQLKSGLLSSIGHASASIASGSSGGSSGGGGGGSYKSIDGHHGNAVDYDPWSFKKSVLNTILQAVKAITGGVTALKGQLIKGSGYALSASGNIVAAGGEKVTDVGKSIINSAQINSHSYGTSHNTGFVHPFAKFSSLSGASSGGSGSKHSSSGPVVHTESK